MENSLSLLETTKLCQEITGKKIAIASREENRQGDVPIFITDSRKVMEKTGWQPQKDAKTTFRDIYQWIRENESLVKIIFN